MRIGQPGSPGGRALPAVLAAVVVAVVVVLLTGRLNAHNEHSTRQQARATRAAATTCVGAIRAGEQTAAAVADKISAMAATAGTGTVTQVRSALDEISATQQPAQPDLAACATNRIAPSACTHSAGTLIQLAAAQYDQARLVLQATTDNAAKHTAAVTADLKSLTAARQKAQTLADSVDDGACAELAGPATGTSAP